MDLALEECRLARKFLCVVVTREYDLDVYFLTGVLACQLILESRDELSRTELQLIVLCASAAERLAVHKSLKVEDESIAHLGLAVLNGFHPGLALLYLLELFLDFLLADLGLNLLDLESLVVLDFYLREYLYRTGKHDRLILPDLR